ncbi:MAG: hypothetical protein IT267_12380 [Saprospiraceae bacterium]|nr:hypothetical protein [Saprospiraceae bacterium]
MKYFKRWAFVLGINLVSFCTVVAMCGRFSDSVTLVKFYESTNGPLWNTKWSLDKPMNTWFGINVDGNGCVTHINLNNNNLTGSIPNEIGNLGALKRLFLFTNAISGELPASIGNLIELEELNLEGNLIGGVIPNSIGNLSKLNNLSLATNEFQSSIPFGIYSLVNLIQLRLNNNNLSGTLLEDIMNFTKLKILDLSENKLIGKVPFGISNCLLLQDLSLNDNLLSGVLPPSMSLLTNLINLWLHNNQFEGLVPDIRGAALLSLRIENNYFTDIPDYSTVKTFGRGDPFGLIMYNNYFTFEDLIPLLNLPRAINWNFKPQRAVQVDSLQYVQFRSNYAIKIFTDPGIADNNYKWFKDTAVLTITNQNFFQILNMDESQEGYYTGSIVNQLFPEFAIEVPAIHIVGFDIDKCNTPLAGKQCDEAPSFCNTNDLNSYCGNMNLSDGVVRSGFCTGIEDLENPRFIKFIASSDSIMLQIFPMSCGPVRINEVDYNGMQAAILKTCDTTKSSSLYCQQECQTKPFYIGGSGFVKGDEYTLVVDGCRGSVCNYLIKVVYGRDYFQLIPESSLEGELVFCPDTNDHFFTLNSIEGAKSYEWTINDTIIKVSQDTFFNVKNSRSGIFKIGVRAFANCDTTNEISKVFRVFPRMSIDSFRTEKSTNDSIYVVKFTISGGSPPYSLHEGSGKLDSFQGDFQSASLFCRSEYFFDIRDRFGCKFIVSGREKCNCDSEAGTMPNELLTICGQQNIIAKNNNDGVKDTGDVALYILFSDPNNPFGSILRTSQSGVIPFDIGRFKFDSIYYLAYVVGKPIGINQINFNHPCLSVSNFQELVFRKKSLVSAGPDNSICVDTFVLSASGNFKQVKWLKISGPNGVSVDNMDSSETRVHFDSVGTYVFRLETSNDYCTSFDEVQIVYDSIYRPIISGVLSICGGMATTLDAGDQNSYLWSTGDTSQTIRVQSSGKYCVHVINSSGCKGDTCVDVKISMLPVFNISGNNKICNDETTILESDQEFTKYSWSTGATSKSILVNAVGRYCLTVTNEEGCSSSKCLEVSNHPITSDIKLDTSCSGSLYVFNDKLYDVPGTYQVLLKGANRFGCDSIVNLNLFEYPKVSLRDSIIIPDYGNSSGSISVNFDGGVQPLKFRWSNSAVTQNLNKLSFGTYTVTVTDAKNCVKTFSFTVKNSVGLSFYDNPIFNIYPNPLLIGQGLFISSGNEADDWSLQIWSVDGILLFEKGLFLDSQNIHSLNLNLRSGVYSMVLIDSRHKRFIQRLVVL